MAEPIGSLYAALGLDSAQFDAGIAKAKASLKDFGKLNFGRGLNTGLDELGKGFQSAAAQTGVLGAGLAALGPAGVAAAAGLAALGAGAAGARKAMAFGDDLADTAARLAVTTKALQEYRFAVHALGGDYADADKALEGFTVAFGLAQANFSTKAVKPFKALGLDPQSFATVEEALDAVVGKIAGLSSAAEQAAIADKLGLGAMLPALRAGTAAIDDAREAANRLGFVMSDELAQKAGAANDRLEDLQQVLEVQLASAMVEGAPLVLGMAEALADAASSARFFFDKLNELNTWSANNDLLAMFGWANQAGAATGKFLGTDQYGPAMLKAFGSKDVMKAPTAAEMRLLFGGAPKPTGRLDTGGGKSSGGDIAGASEQAIETARRAELSARMALTQNIERLTEMRLLEVNGETKAANDALRRSAAAGKVTKAAAEQAIALNNETAMSKTTAILREREQNLAQAALDQRGEINRYSAQTLRFEGAAANSALERGRIEAAALENEQQLARDTLAAENARLVLSGKRTDAEAAALVAAQEEAQLAARNAQAQENRFDVARETSGAQRDMLSLQIDLLASAGANAQSDYARGVIGLRILELQQQIARLKAQEVVDTTIVGSAAHNTALAYLALLDEIQDNEMTAARAGVRLDTAMLAAARDVTDAFTAFKRNDLEGSFNLLADAARGFAGLLGKTGNSLLGKLGVAGSTIGATAGIGQALGINGSNSSVANLALGAGGYALGTMFSAQIAAGVGTAIAGGATALGASAATAMSAGLAGVTGALSLAGPIGVLAALAVGGMFSGGKASNNAAIATLNGDSFALSGNKRNEQTSQLASAAASTIIDSVSALEAAGITLNDSVHAIDIGTRDAAHIILTSGRQFSAGVGDAAGAADAALQALLDGATYASDAQEKLVRSMLSAGAGFDKISEALNLFGEQMKLPQSIDDAIQQLSDPQAYEKTMLSRAQADRRTQVNAAIAAGVYSDEQVANLLSQLTRLEGLEFDQVLARYAEKVGDAADTMADRVRKADDDVAAAQDDLRDAYQVESSALRDSAKRFGTLAQGLRSFNDQLRDELIATRGPGRQAVITRASLEAMAAALPAGDEAALGELQDAATAFLQASKSTAPNVEAYQRDIAWVRRLVGQGTEIAQAQADTAEQSLAVLNEQVRGLIKIDESVISVRGAIDALTAALQTQAAARASAAGGGTVQALIERMAAADSDGGAIDVAAFDVGKYLADNKDLAKNWQAGGILTTMGGTLEEAALVHYQRTGQYEIEAGLRKFATGGRFGVGGSGSVDSQLVQFMASPDEFVSVTHGDPLEVMTAQVGALEAALAPALVAIAKNTAIVAKLNKDWDGRGTPPIRS